MIDSAMKKTIALLTTALLFTTLSAQAAEPLALQQVMKDLGENMQIATDAISREDCSSVEHTAHLIGEHAQTPQDEKMRITGFMGSNMGKFKAFGEQTHQAAHQMAEAARQKNGQKVIAASQKLQSSCLSCHQAFRPAFVKHFYQNTE